MSVLSEYRGQLASVNSAGDTPAIAQARQKLVAQRRELVNEAAIGQINASLQQGLTAALTRFWFNHFNVYGDKGIVGAAIPDYVQVAIEPAVLGSFKDLLRAAVLHPAMLVYLDNDRNRVGRINENMARELLELHTLGVEGGYTQQDVGEVARVLTGFGLRPLQPTRWPARWEPYVVQQGEFLFDPRQHDFGVKRVLGHTITGEGFGEMDQLLALLVRQRATANHICRKLVMFLLGEQTPASVTDDAALLFLRTQGDLRQVVTFLQQVSGAAAGLRTYKDPYRWVLSSLALLLDGRPVANLRPVLRWMQLLGQPVFGHRTPDGYSLKGSDWVNTGQLTQRFELAQEMIAVLARLVTQAPAAAEILESASVRSLIASASPATARSVARAEDPATALALLLASPEWMYWSPWHNTL